MPDQPEKLCIAHSHFVLRFGRCVCLRPVNRGPALPKKPRPPKFVPEPPQPAPHPAKHESQIWAAEKLRQYAISKGAPADTAELVFRVAVFLRDGGRCQICGRIVQLIWHRRTTPPEDRFTLDHIVPISKGGEHTYANIQAACEPCNNSKGNEVDFMAGNKDSVQRGVETQKEQARRRLQEANPGILGKDPDNPIPPSERWAKQQGLIKDAD